jgi:hypothetical protein
MMFENAEVIDSYTREQAIADGVLVDVTKMAKEAGFKWPVAITSELHTVISNIPEEYRKYQNYKGRLWDLLYIGCLEARMCGSASQISYRLIMHHENKKFLDVKMVCVPIGMDDPSPAITIMMPEED